MLRLAPNSGIQFVEIDVRPATITRPLLHFVEDRFEDEGGLRTVLIPADRSCIAGDVLYHPVTHVPVAYGDWLSVSPAEAIEPFLGRWIPLPFLRFMGRNATGRPSLDEGPSNWVRAFICDPGCGLPEASAIRVVLAFDTALVNVSRVDSTAYLAPTVEDASFGSTFMLEHDVTALASFLGEQWIDRWLQQAVRAWHRDADSHAGSAETGNPRFELEHIARYMTLLAVLTAGDALPQVRFTDPKSPRQRSDEVAVDLVLDITNHQTVALLCEQGAGPAEVMLADAATLELRELSNPAVIHRGPIPTAIEFDDGGFGDLGLSRRSGRLSAFAWPSPARIGEEAHRLSLRETAAPGVTGLARLKSRLLDTAPNSVPWRYGREHGGASGLGPMVAGEAISQYREDGSSLRGGVPALRPMFSASSMIGLFVGELLLHALSQINAPSRNLENAVDERVRHIDRIILTTAAAVPVEERRLLLERVEGAVEALWRGLGWHDGSALGHPPRPHVVHGLHADLGAQLIFLHEEINGKFAGNVASFVEVCRRPRRDLAPTPALRIASVNLGSQHSNIAVVDYELARTGSLHPTLSHAERSAVAGDALANTLADRHVLPAIEAALTAAGVRDAAMLMATAFGTPDAAAARGGNGGNTGAAVEPGRRFPPYFSQRMRHRVVEPAASALLHAYFGLPVSGVAGLADFELVDLVRAGGGRLDPLVHLFDQAAVDAGAGQFELAACCLTISWREIAATIGAELAPLIGLISDMTHQRECDLLILSGRLSRLSDIEEALLGQLPMAPHRIVNLAHRDSQLLQLQRHPNPAMPMAALMGAAGASLVSRHAGHAGTFDLFAPPAQLGREACGGGDGKLIAAAAPVRSGIA